jgi:hypothetical protein
VSRSGRRRGSDPVHGQLRRKLIPLPDLVHVASPKPLRGIVSDREPPSVTSAVRGPSLCECMAGQPTTLSVDRGLPPGEHFRARRVRNRPRNVAVSGSAAPGTHA